MDIEDALQKPIIYVMPDKDKTTIEFARLTMDELITWAGQIKAQRRLMGIRRAKADKQLSNFERHQLEQEYDTMTVDLGTVIAASYTPAGILRALLMGYMKQHPKASEKDAAPLIRKIHYQDQAKLARRILSPPDQEIQESLAEEEGDVNPLVENDATDETGISSLLASGTSAESTTQQD